MKRLFVTKKYRDNEKPEEYEFIQSTAYDNTALLKRDPDYIKNMLDTLPDGLRAAWRDGNWDMLAGQYFSEFDRQIHVVAPFNIPEHWRKYRGMDYGLDCLACVWIAIDERGYYYIYREYAESDKPISVGAKEIISLTPSEEHIEYTAAPPDMWGRSQESGKTKADLFYENGLPLLKSSNNREAGWLAIKELMQIRGNETRLMIFDNCVEFIDCLTSLQRDQRHPTDCMTEPHEITHLPDALRYFAMQFTTASGEYKPQKTPLEKYRDKVISGRKRNGRRYY